jgi:DNA-binding transcriptional ArsR family regulator
VTELAAGLPVSRPAVSQHLKVLKEANLVRERPRGTRRFYEVNPSGLDPLRIYLEEFWGEVLEAFKTVANASQGGKANGQKNRTRPKVRRRQL